MRFFIFLSLFLLWILPVAAQDLVCTEFTADDHFQQGQIYQAEGQVEDALAAYECTVQLVPEYEEAYQGLGDLYYVQDNYEAALGAYQNYVALAGNQQENYIAQRISQIEDQHTTDTIGSIILIVVGLVVLIPVFIVLRVLWAIWGVRREVVMGLNSLQQINISQIDVEAWRNFAQKMQQEMGEVDFDVPSPDDTQAWAEFTNGPQLQQLLTMLKELPLDSLQTMGMDVPDQKKLIDMIEGGIETQPGLSPDANFNDDDNPIQEV